MADLTQSELQLVKKALAVAALAMARQPGPLQSRSDMTDMKVLLGRLTASDNELVYYAHAAHLAVAGARG